MVEHPAVVSIDAMLRDDTTRIAAWSAGGCCELAGSGAVEERVNLTTG
jgi:hypothetical protein